MLAGTLTAEMKCQTTAVELQFSPINSNILFSGHWDRVVRVWNINEKTNVELQGQNSCVFGLCVSDDGALLCSTCYDGVICVFDVAHDNVMLWRKETRHRTYCNPVFHNGAFIVASFGNDTVGYDAMTGNELFKLSKHQKPLRMMIVNVRKTGESSH